MHMRIHFAIAFIISTVATSAACESVSPAMTLAFSESVLVGVKLSVAQGVRAGKVPSNRGQCVAALPSNSFSDVVDGLLSQHFAAPELRQAESFFASEVGKKYTQHGKLQAYQQLGEPLPSPLPNFSDAEYKLLESFAATKVGDALIKQKIMESPTSRQAYQARIRELLAQCAK